MALRDDLANSDSYYIVEMRFWFLLLITHYGQLLSHWQAVLLFTISVMNRVTGIRISMI